MRIDIITVLPEMIEGFVSQEPRKKVLPKSICTTSGTTLSTSGAESTIIHTAVLREW